MVILFLPPFSLSPFLYSFSSTLHCTALAPLPTQQMLTGKGHGMATPIAHTRSRDLSGNDLGSLATTGIHSWSRHDSVMSSEGTRYSEMETRSMFDSVLPSSLETPSQYLERHVFPVLLPGIEETLQVAKKTEVCIPIVILLRTTCNGSVVG